MKTLPLIFKGKRVKTRRTRKGASPKAASIPVICPTCLTLITLSFDGKFKVDGGVVIPPYVVGKCMYHEWLFEYVEVNS